MDALIKSGCFDEFEERGKLIGNMEDMLAYNHEGSKQNTNQISLFGATTNTKAPEFKMKDAPEATQMEKLLSEKELLGLYISGHPLDRLKDKLESRNINIKKIKEGTDINVGNGREVTIAGIIEASRQVITKKNDRMAFLRIADLTDSIEAVCFPSVFAEFAEILVPEKCIALSGKVSLKNGEKSIIVDNLKEI